MRIQCISRPRAHLLLADHRDVVLGLAGDDAGVAADAGVQVDRHAPGVARRTGCGGYSVRSLAGSSRHLARRTSGSCRNSLERGRRGPGARPSMRVVLLRARPACSCSPVFATSTPRAEPRRVAGAQRVGVEADAVADAPGRACARSRGARVTAVVGLAGHDPDRRRRRCGRRVATARPRRSFCDARAARPSPGSSSAALSQVSLVSGFGQLLQPAVVGEAAVVDGRVEAEDELETRRRRPVVVQRGRTRPAVRSATVFAGSAVPATTPSCSARAPEPLEVAGRRAAPASARARCRSRGRSRPAASAASTSCADLAAVERRDQRLHDA